mgnify:CR=1 FL=1
MRLPIRDTRDSLSWSGKGWAKAKKVALTVVRSLVM